MYTEEEEGRFSSRCLELPGAVGQTLEELKVNMIDAAIMHAQLAGGIGVVTTFGHL